MDEIYKKYSKKVYLYLYSLTRDKELSEELMQDTFYSAIKYIDNFRGECNISVWLCQIAKNKWIDELKKQKRLKTLSIEENDVNFENILIDNQLENEVIYNEEKISLYKRIHKLDELTREVIYLRIKADLSFKDIGNILDKSEQWARITFYRGKIKLKEEYKDEQ